MGEEFLSQEVLDVIRCTKLPGLDDDVREALLALASIEIHSQDGPLSPGGLKRYNEIRDNLMRIGIAIEIVTSPGLRLPVCGRIASVPKLLRANPELFRFKNRLLGKVI